MKIKLLLFFSFLVFSHGLYSNYNKGIGFVPGFSYYKASNFNLYGVGFSIDKDFAISKRFSINTGLAYSTYKGHKDYKTDSSFLQPSPTASLRGSYYENRQLSQLSLPVNVNYLICNGTRNSLSISLGLELNYYLVDKSDGEYYVHPFYIYHFDPGPYPYTENRLTNNRGLLNGSIANSFTIDYCHVLSTRLDLNYRIALFRELVPYELFFTFSGVGIRLKC